MTTQFRLLAIDPGAASGALCLLTPPKSVTGPHLDIRDIPITHHDFDPTLFAALVRELSPEVAVVERVHAMPKQGVSSTFKFGKAYGAILATLAAHNIPTHLVAPTVWKKAFALHGDKNSDKDAARQHLLRIRPDLGGFLKRKSDHNRADAALLALYFARREGWL